MKVIFLDVDGVLNYNGGESRLSHLTYFVEDEKIKLLRDIVDETGAEIVLSSSWRSGWSLMPGDNRHSRHNVDDSGAYFRLCAKLHDFGLGFLSEIPRVSGGNKEDDINYWLAKWPGEKIDSYIILDDEGDKFSDDNGHLILTSPEYGLREEDVEKAVRMLNYKNPSNAHRKILVVDDIELNRAVIAEMLRSSYDVIEADNGVSALEKMESNDDITAVVTDVQMPEMNGIELVKILRSNPKYKDVAILVNTQYGDMEQEQLLLELGQTILSTNRPHRLYWR